MEMRITTGRGREAKVAKAMFVDLAGSENAEKSGATKDKVRPRCGMDDLLLQRQQN